MEDEEKMYVTINEDNEGVFEMFTQLGKSGGCQATQAEAIARLISLALRSRIDTARIIDQLKGIRCPSPTLTENGAILSCPDAIAKALESYISEKKISLEIEYNQEYNNINYKELGEFIKNVKGCKYYSLFTLVCIIVFIFLPFNSLSLLWHKQEKE